jgi:hypothetical protein
MRHLGIDANTYKNVLLSNLSTACQKQQHQAFEKNQTGQFG